jgi:hypothetical protein
MEKVKRNMIPYSVYLQPEMHARIVGYAKEGKASALIRDGIESVLNDGDNYKAGYNRALSDVIKTIGKIAGINKIAYEGKYIDTLIVDRIKTLEMH